MAFIKRILNKDVYTNIQKIGWELDEIWSSFQKMKVGMFTNWSGVQTFQENCKSS